MNKVRLTILASIAMLMAACASSPSAPGAKAAKAPNLAGEWVLTISSQMGAQDSAMSVQQTGNQLAGTVSGQMGSAPMTGKVDGSKVDFAFTIEFGGNSIKVEQAGTIEPDGTMKGTAKFGQFGEGTFLAKKK